MNPIITKILTAAFLFATASTVSASTYTGTWNNTTFETSGALTIEFERTKTEVTGSFDFDGPVFGAGDPPAIPFSAPLSKNGSGNFEVLGTEVGDVSVSFTRNGKLTLIITNIPGGILSEARVDGKFDLVAETFTATYGIDTLAGPFAEGNASARVIKAPTIKVIKNVRFAGKRSSVNTRVISNSEITSITAEATGGVKVRVHGKNPYQIKVRDITARRTEVTIAVTNVDGLTSTKVITFIRKGRAPSIVE